MQSSPPLSVEEVGAADRKLKLWRKTHPKPPQVDAAAESKKVWGVRGCTYAWVDLSYPSLVLAKESVHKLHSLFSWAGRAVGVSQAAKAEAKAKAAAATADAEMAAFDGPSPQGPEGPLRSAANGHGDEAMAAEGAEGAEGALDGDGDVTMRSPKRRRSDKGPATEAQSPPTNAMDAWMASV